MGLVMSHNSNTYLAKGSMSSVGLQVQPETSQRLDTAGSAFHRLSIEVLNLGWCFDWCLSGILGSPACRPHLLLQVDCREDDAYST